MGNAKKNILVWLRMLADGMRKTQSILFTTASAGVARDT